MEPLTEPVLARSEPATRPELVELVQRHGMKWRLWPLQAYVENHPVVIGYAMTLHGVHDHPAHTPEAGCDACVPVYAALRAVASAVLPHRVATQCSVSSFEPKLVVDHGHHGAPAIELRIEISHRSGYSAPLDDCELRCKDDIVAALQALGVRQESG